MDWNLFWTAFGAIGATLGAMATAAAVIVALWQTKYANRKKLKIEFHDSTAVIPPGGDFSQKLGFVSISVTNIGNKQAQVCSWQFYSRDRRFVQIIPDASLLSQRLAPPWPILLNPEEQSSQYIEKRLFYRFIKTEWEGYKNRRGRLTMAVIDSTNRIYKVKSEKTIAKYLAEAEDFFNTQT